LKPGQNLAFYGNAGGDGASQGGDDLDRQSDFN
jgi:hypothetical protein